MSRVYQLAPSILSADFNRLGEQIQRVEKAECRWLHIDIMDGICTIHFVWNAGGKVDPKRKQSVF